SLDHLDIEVPEDLVILTVDSDGLTYWSRPRARHLLLRYDRDLSKPRRRLRISGWIPVIGDPLIVGTQQQRVPTPWMRIQGMETLPGLLIVTGPSKAEIVKAPGMTAESPAPLTPAGAPDARFRQSFRVDDPSRLGELHWNPAPPHVNVLIE